MKIKSEKLVELFCEYAEYQLYQPISSSHDKNDRFINHIQGFLKENNYNYDGEYLIDIFESFALVVHGRLKYMNDVLYKGGSPF